MRGVFNILSPWKVILLFPLLFFFGLSQSYALDVTLQWDANTDPDPAGYKVYYGIESRHPDNPNAYSGTGALQGDSPIDITLAQDENLDPNIVEFTLTGLDDNKVYFFAVTAYDIDSLESGYSNEEMTLGIAWPGGGFYVNDEPGSPNYGSPYTVRGRADKQTEVELYYDSVSVATKLGEATADDNRDWELAVDFELEFVEGPVTLIVKLKLNDLIAPAVTATYDPTDPTSAATGSTSVSAFISVTWEASDATSGVGSTELWCKPPGGIWNNTGYSRTGTSGVFYYAASQGDGTYYFATRSVDRAGNWEIVPLHDGDCSVVYTSESGRGEGNGGCFIDTAMSTSINF